MANINGDELLNDLLRKVSQSEKDILDLRALANVAAIHRQNVNKKVSELEASVKTVQDQYQNVTRPINARPLSPSSSSTSDVETIQANLSEIYLKVETLSSLLDLPSKVETMQRSILEIQRDLGDLSSDQKVNCVEVEDAVKRLDDSQYKIRQIEGILQILQNNQSSLSPDKISEIQNIPEIREDIKKLFQLLRKSDQRPVTQSKTTNLLSRILLLTIIANLTGLGLGLHFFVQVQEQYKNYSALEMESYNLSFNARLVSLEKQLDSFPNQAELQPELDTLRSEIDQLKTQYQGLTSQDSNLQRRIQALEQQVQALESSRSTTHENSGNLLW
ncbi:MAG: hypothetical protein VKJ64_17075 [Leptolyngbyaceae bacterium]|nr:hypothetical protein [Leptolyngbyaceae bacterium]